MQRPDTSFIGLPGIDHRLLKNILQKTLIRSTYRIELIDIDQCKTGKQQLCIPLIAEIDTIRIIHT